MQVVCDYLKRIRHVVVGYPGSAHDARIYNNCSLAKHPQFFFTDKQWIAGDSAYKNTETVITPYRSSSSEFGERKKFNLYFSKYRVRIEHCLGKLKEIFQSLKELRMRIHNEKSNMFLSDWVMTCCILYNVLHMRNVQINDETEDFSDTEVEACEEGDHETAGTHDSPKRKYIYEIIKNRLK